MSLPDRELLELNELCQALLDGALSEADRARLEQVLASSEEARRFYVRTMALSASLYEYAGEMQSEAPEPRPVPANERPARGLWWTIGSLAAAAMLMLGLWFGQHTGQSARDKLALGDGDVMSDMDDVVAHLSATQNGKWKGAAFGAGEELHRGQQLQLISGLVEVAFDSGAVVTLEGPATLQLTSEWEAVLHRGTLKAQVPHEAIGFRISNPAVEVTDLGTEFSMVADANGATEVFVLKGSVETRASEESQPLVLRETEARRFAKGKHAAEVADRELKWHRLARLVALERAPRPLHFLHCSFDVDQGGTPVSGVPWLRAPVHRGDFNAAEAPVVAGQFLQGFQMSALSYGALPLSDELRSAPVQTVAFWLKVPSSAGHAESSPIVSWSRPGNHGARVAIGWNGLPGQGPLGALRTSLGRGSVVGETSIRDEQWHHIAIILAPARRNADKLQVRQYIDGRLDGVSARRPLKRGRPPEAAADGELWLGRTSAASTENFRGAIDELYVVDRALSPQEIHQLMETNELPGMPVAL